MVFLNYQEYHRYITKEYCLSYKSYQSFKKKRKHEFYFKYVDSVNAVILIEYACN